MEHVLPHPSPPGPERHHPWRTIAVVAAGLAMLELLGLVVVGVALVAKPMAHHAIAEAVKAPAVTKPKPEPTLPLLPRRLTSVTILNGNGVAGAAASEASRVRARGYIVGKVGNAPRGSYGHSVVMYRAGRVREARRLARDLGVAIVSPLDGLRKGDLHGAKLALVVGG
ncbi:MAG TPA: LytR C-terminal domain-containing protein [Gaiellaceae bacterium]|nr:LytR C-terminal domain-containing protein [Gaiellaceae bacterium]